MKRRTLLLTAALTLSGCATNTLRLERATALGSAGDRATAGMQGLVAQVDVANRESAIEVAALDPACTLPTPLIASTSASAPAAFICRVGARQPGDFDLHRLDPADFAPALATIDALATYLGAVDAIAGAKPVDYGDAFLDARAKLDRVSDDLTTLTGVAAPSLLTKAQAGAVADALSLIGTLADEQDRVRRLRALESPEQRARFTATTVALRAVQVEWSKVLLVELDKQDKVADLTLQLGRVPADGMRAFRAQQMDAIDHRAAAQALGTRLARAIDALDRSHAAYLDLLTNAGAKLTPAERRRRAALIETRLLTALDSLAGLVRAF